MKKEIIVLGDIEMGSGTFTDDFISDNLLSQMILELKDREHPLDLVLNGDTFDFLKCPVIVNGTNTYPRHITEKISLLKLKQVYQAHQLVFTALKNFLEKKDKHLYFVLGNHDPDLVYKKVQRELKKILNNNTQVHFPGFKYKHNQVYVEHGQQYDFLNKVSAKHPFLTYNGEKVLNIPWVSFSLISNFMQTKEVHPFMERIFPRPKLFAHHGKMFKKITYQSLFYLLKSLAYYPFKYRYDPTYTYPKELLREFYRRLKKIHWDVDQIIDKFKRKKRKSKHKIYVLGHVHEKYLEEKKGKVFIHPGSWRDEYDLDDNKKLVPRTKRYVKIIIEDDDSLSYRLVSMPNERNPLDFDLVRMDEHSHIRLAAEMEGYNYSVFRSAFD
ncbi:MAG: metallophosphoesterase [Nanoarchaeota archaeon]|nr:metallophosphoesterase [Nanoarchaeota archaeon]MBU1644277.1 metallophosphoesterase [Nanoarchaeota archaeon]MBU1977267.1 metallophosphoesterase [Nanoarchaeota archaeon]